MNIAKDKKIINFIEHRYLNSDTNITEFNNLVVGYFSYIYELSEEGVIYNYSNYENNIKNSVFNSNNDTYLRVINYLNIDGIININNNTLFILIYNSQELIYKKLLNPVIKRKYNRNPLQFQETIKGTNQDNFMTYKGLGFKVPEYYFKFLMTYDYKDTDSMNFEELNNHMFISKITKEYKKFLLLLLSHCTSKGKIENFNLYNVWSTSKNEYKGCFGCYETFRNALNLFIDNNVLSIKTNNNRNCLIFNNYKDYFGNGQRFILIPFSLFNMDLDGLSAAALSLSFKVLFLLNNGESNNNNSEGYKRTLYIKLFNNPFDPADKRMSYNNKILSLLKKRCNSEVLACIKELHTFFIFSKSKNSNLGIYGVRIKGKYYVNKKHTIAYKEPKDYVLRYPKRADFLNNLISKYDHQISMEDLGRLIRAFNNYKLNKKDIKLVLSSAVMEIKTRNLKNKDPIKSITGWAIMLFNEMLKGNYHFLNKTKTNYDTAFNINYNTGQDTSGDFIVKTA